MICLQSCDAEGGSAETAITERPIIWNGFIAQRAPFRLHEVVQVVVVPAKQYLQTLTHWFNCFESIFFVLFRNARLLLIGVLRFIGAAGQKYGGQHT